MSVELVVTGIPGDVTFPRVLGNMRDLLKRIHIKAFWILDIADGEGYMKQITIKFNNNSDARKARNYLDNMAFKFNRLEYPMRAYIPDVQQEPMNHFVDEDEYEDWGRKRRPNKRARVRSRSPVYRDEATKLDLEIQLLRKQRQVIEEERRLLMEQKKLEMIKEYGPSVSREFESFKDYEPPRKRRQPEPVPKRPQQEAPRAPRIPKASGTQPRLPLFFQPCKKLLSQMRPHIDKDATPEEVDILVKLIRAAIRKDLAIALEGKDYMKHVAIVDLYRERHPPEQDAAFVAKILANIRASFMTPEVKVKEEKAEDVPKDTENQNDQKGEGDKAANDDQKGEGDQIANDDQKGEVEKTPGDNPENGEKETDDATGAIAEPAQNPVSEVSQTNAEEKNTGFVAADNSVLDEMTKVKEEELLADDANSADWVAEQ
ncbi:uncharacterized protein LOC125237176 [Leguminivora glycinivorella]|uniref:uncharacterized protein LOC125237176 n=1 Tax=Leguminivora glycinivorella TaxID=1035111 RepID=UPI00200DA6C9|nr:uncharacterized protein LOC125237176 [Leguminivora glycinivorella]